MIKLFLRWKYKLPMYYKDVWYNCSAHMDDRKYPVIFDSEKHYIPCTIGNAVVMDELPDGRKVYYKITSRRRTSGGDWLYDTDAINCNLKFSHIK